MPRVYIREQARRDLIENFVYLADNVGLDTAERFLTNAKASFDELISGPLIGSSVMLRNPELAGIRKWRVKGFDDLLIFYIPYHDGVSIMRVLHAAQNWWGLLGLIQ